jgi:hypothetical protein
MPDARLRDMQIDLARSFTIADRPVRVQIVTDQRREALLHDAYVSRGCVEGRSDDGLLLTVALADIQEFDLLAAG